MQLAKEAMDGIAKEKAWTEEAKKQREKKERQVKEREEWHRKNWEDKVKAAVGQSSPPSKAQADAQLPLARALISQPCTEPPPTAQQLSGLVQSFQEVNSDLAKKQQEWQAKEKAAATRKLTKKEKEEQWRWSMEDGTFKMLAGRQQLINRFKVIIDRHQKRQMMRNEIALGRAELDPRVHSKRYNREVAEIR